jgi:hypothetical protein
VHINSSDPIVGVSRQNINNKIKSWMDNQHLAMWRVPCSTQTQARKLISDPSPTKSPDYYPLIGHNPGSLLAFLLDITP